MLKVTKMTEQQRLQAFAVYRGAEARHTNISDYMQSIGTKWFPSHDCILTREGSLYFEWGVSRCQLLLAPLTEITDEHVLLIAEMTPIKYMNFSESGKILFCKNDIVNLHIPIRASDKLRELGYAIDWNGFDLVAEGVAVLKSKI